MELLRFFHLPAKILIILVAILCISQMIGAIMDIKGDIAPEILNIKKFFKRRKEEKEQMRQLPKIIEDIGKSLLELNNKFEKDTDQNILMHQKLEDKLKELDLKLQKNTNDTVDILVENNRNIIINFASTCTNAEYIGRSIFNRIFKIHEKYEQIIKDNNLTNGEVDIAYEIIEKEYQRRLVAGEFKDNEL